MAKEEESFRTHAYHLDDKPSYNYVFWVMSPSYNKPGFQIRQHDVSRYGSSSMRLHDELGKQEAFLKMIEIEREAAKMKIIEEQVAAGDKILDREEFRDAKPHHPHSEALVSGINNAHLRLRKKNPNLKLKL